MPWARGSELDRAVECPASHHLPRVVDLVSSDAARWGTTMHAWKETGEWPSSALQYRRRQAALDVAGVTRDSLWPSGGRHEVSYALHTANRLVSELSGGHSREEREAWKRSFDSSWVTGTADYVGDLLGTPWVDDLKTGREVPQDPWTLWQLRFYAVCLALTTGAAEVVTSLLHWPRYPADGPPRPRLFSEVVTRTELLGITLPMLEYARQAGLRSAANSQPITHPGEHCRWCPCDVACPVPPEHR